MTPGLFLAGIALGAAFFAAAAYAGALCGSALAERIPIFEDTPPLFDPPVPLLVAGAALVGAFVTVHEPAPWRLFLCAALCAVLTAIWVTDARRGVVPDALTLLPLVAVLAWALATRTWTVPISVAVPLLPFAAAAAVSKGRGMGWGDVKLVALGGACLGAPIAIGAFTVACLAAVLVNLARGRRRGAIVFAPYLATAIAGALPFVVLN